MPTIIDLVTKFTADVGNFKKDIDSAEQKVSHLHVTLKNVAKVAAGAAVVGITTLTGVMIGSIATTMSWAGTMGSAGRAMGTTAQETAGLAVIARETGSDLDTMTTQVAFMARGLEDANGGLGTAGKALQTLGINFKDTNGKMRPTAELLQEVANKLSQMPDSLEKTALQMDLFGRSAKDVGKQMSAIASGGLTAAQEKAEKLGLVMSKADAEGVKKLKTSLADIKLMSTGFAVSLGTELLPMLVPVLADFTKWGIDAMPKLRQAIKDAIPFIENLAKQVADVAGHAEKLINFLDSRSVPVLKMLGVQMKEVAYGTQTYAEYLQDAKALLDVFVNSETEANKITQAQADALPRMTEAEWEAYTAQNALTDATSGYSNVARTDLAEAQAKLAEGYKNSTFDIVAYEVAQGKLNDTAVIATAVTKDMTLAQWDQNVLIHDLAVQAHDAAVELGEKLSGAYDKLKTAQQSWLTNVGSAALAAMENTKYLSKTQQEQIKEVIDAATGSTYIATDQMNADLAAAMLEFKKTGDPEQLKKDIEAVAAKFEEKLAPNIKAAKDEVIKLQAELDELNNRHITTYIDIVYNNNPPSVLRGPAPANPTGPNKVPGPPPEEYASGGLVTQPGLYQLAEHGAELVLNADQTKRAMAGGGGIGGVVHNHYYEIAANYAYQEENDIVQAIRQLQMLEG